MRATGKTLAALIHLFVAATLFAGTPNQAAARDITVGVVSDGPGSGSAIRDKVEAELKLITGATVNFKSAPEFNAGWKMSGVRPALMAALNDPEVDYVMVVNLIAAREAGASDLVLTKPVLVAIPEHFGYFEESPYEINGKFKKNLSVIHIPQGLVRDIETFREMIPFDTCHVAIDDLYAEEFHVFSKGQDEFEDSLGLDIELLPVSDDISRTLVNVGDGVDVVVLAFTPRLSLAKRAELIEGLTAKGIPTFSIIGHPDVEIGALAALVPELDGIVARRVALNLNLLIRGGDVGDLPILLPIELSPLVNGRTAVAVGYAPTFEERIWAEFLYPEALRVEETPLTFKQALGEAEKGNTALTIKDANVDVFHQEKQLARSPLLPQIDASGTYNAYQAGPLDDLLPTNSGRAGVSLTQMIYDDRLVSDYRSSKRLFESAEYEREAARLDVLGDAGVAFLRYVLARVSYEIVAANVNLTSDNLELAKVRFDVGYSGQDEVYRWEAELARRRQNLFQSEADIEAERIAFNQILGVEQSKSWQPQEVDVDPEEFFFLDGRIDPIFKDARKLARFREFVAQFAIENAPELMFIDKAAESEEIQLARRKRSFFIPAFGTSLQYDYFIHNNPGIPEGVDQNYFNFRVFASYPLFNGGGRLYDMRRSRSILEGLNREEQFIREIIEKSARTATRNVENSFPTIKFAKMEASSSNKNLDIVREKYAQGIVNVTDLLEAQTNAFTAEQNAARTVYRFLIDLVDFQRAISWFEDERTQEEKEELVRRIQAAVEAP